MSPRKPMTQEERDEIAAKVRANPPECRGSWEPDWTNSELREWAYEHGMPSSGPDS